MSTDSEISSTNKTVETVYWGTETSDVTNHKILNNANCGEVKKYRPHVIRCSFSNNVEVISRVPGKRNTSSKKPKNSILRDFDNYYVELKQMSISMERNITRRPSFVNKDKDFKR